MFLGGLTLTGLAWLGLILFRGRVLFDASRTQQPEMLVDQSGANSNGTLQPGAEFASDPEHGSGLKLNGTIGFAEVKQHNLIDHSAWK